MYLLYILNQFVFKISQLFLKRSSRFLREIAANCVTGFADKGKKAEERKSGARMEHEIAERMNQRFARCEREKERECRR